MKFFSIDSLFFSSMSTDLTIDFWLYNELCNNFVFFGSNYEPGERLQAPRSL